jgi:hypothetical protein
MSGIVTICSALGINSDALILGYEVAWIGEINKITIPNSKLITNNPNRLCSRTARRLYSIAGLPNHVGKHKVHFTKVLEYTEDLPYVCDWLSAVVSLKAWSVVSEFLGIFQQDDMNVTWTLKYEFGDLIKDSRMGIGGTIMTSNFKGALKGADKDRLVDH